METNAINALVGANYQNKGVLEADRIRYVLYSRKSTEQDELQALSIDSQIHEMTMLAGREGLLIVDILKESHSAKDSGQRPVFQEMVKGIREGKYSGIIAWDPSRISRNAGDLGSIVDLMDQKLLFEIRTFGQRFSNSPNEKFLLMILCSQAKLENDHKGENVKRGLRAKCAQGWRPGVPPLGYMHDENMKKGNKKVLVDPVRAPIIKQMFEKVAYDNVSGRDLYTWLKDDVNFTTRTGKRVALSAIYVILKDTYYYGEFEYPKGIDTWYKNGCEPIITKELYLKAQANLLAPHRRHPGTNEFDFVRLFYCGACSSGICAEEKFKHQKSGVSHRYVYYHCTKFKDKYCKEKAIREEELVNQLLSLISKISIDEIDVKERIQKEILRYKKFSYAVLGRETEFEQPTEMDIRNYFKYVLLEGTKDEKRELIGCLKSKLQIKNKEICLKIE